MMFSSQTLSIHHVIASAQTLQRKYPLVVHRPVCLSLSVSLYLCLSLTHKNDRLRVTLFQKNSLLEICFICSVASRSRKLMD